jgi:hypothetical protein
VLDDLTNETQTTTKTITEEKRAALSYISEMFAEAQHDGLDDDCMIHAAIFFCIRLMVQTYGEDAVADFMEDFPNKIRAGAFSIALRH